MTSGVSLPTLGLNVLLEDLDGGVASQVIETLSSYEDVGL